MSDVVISSRVRLARNYMDLPFQARCTPADKQMVIDRTLFAMHRSNDVFEYCPMQKLDTLKRTELMEEHLISPNLYSEVEWGAVLIRKDHHVAIMINEEDHIRIQAITQGVSLLDAAKLVYSADDYLQYSARFAYDSQLGFLTACPTNTGTGMRASFMLHLPLLTMLKQMGTVSQLAAKLGLTIRGFFGEGSRAEGNVYQLSNQVTLGRTETEIIEAVTAVARQVIDMECMLRKKAVANKDIGIADQVYRSYGILQYSRRMPIKEFMLHWSNIRLGSALSWLPLSVAYTDTILVNAQPAHVQKNAGKPLDGYALDEARSEQIRNSFAGGR